VELLVGQIAVKLQPLGETARVRVAAPCEYVVLPDFFADDIVISAKDLEVNRAQLPSENFLLQLVDHGNSIVMSVWDNHNQEIGIELAGSGVGRRIESSEIAFDGGGCVWVALIDEPGAWYSHEVRIDQKDAILDMAWRQPYSAVWRVDWRRSDKLTDTWEMAVENEDGTFRKSDLFEVSRDEWTDQDWWSDKKPRRRWNTGLGFYWYPCWIDKEGRGHLQPLKDRIEFDGPAIVYPINRSRSTPVDKYTITDVVRHTLGVGPCQYILDLEGQKSTFKGRPTCDVRDRLNEIYAKGEHLTRQDDVRQALDDVLTFIRLIRGRIDAYGDFAREMENFLANAERAGAAPTAFIEATRAICGKVNGAIERRRDGIKTPAYATALVEEFRDTLVGYRGTDAETRCKVFTERFVEIGDNQDELVAECRLAVKLLRQHAALALARDPGLSDVVAQIRDRTQFMLRDPVNYEAARH
jgi:hypothetical protein